jgi:hypothetical protein
MQNENSLRHMLILDFYLLTTLSLKCDWYMEMFIKMHNRHHVRLGLHAIIQSVQSVKLWRTPFRTPMIEICIIAGIHSKKIRRTKLQHTFIMYKEIMIVIGKPIMIIYVRRHTILPSRTTLTTGPHLLTIRLSHITLES